jgi:hypothetical protein
MRTIRSFWICIPLAGVALMSASFQKQEKLKPLFLGLNLIDIAVLLFALAVAGNILLRKRKIV